MWGKAERYLWKTVVAGWLVVVGLPAAIEMTDGQPAYELAQMVFDFLAAPLRMPVFLLTALAAVVSLTRWLARRKLLRPR